MSLIGEAVKIRREELGWGQEELARRVGVGQQTVSRWEHGLAGPRREHVARLADALGLESRHLHRLAGFLPPEEASPSTEVVHAVYASVTELTDQELLLVLDRVWQEYRRRQGLTPPGVA
ncbi:helix-turn-helix transcriptional regulator [Motilibacter deserti]|uniref:Helix-turn-helix transcriptional regulator n=1 Tax=Motilibacter deserti TaxID=2714956 RepID=A0ABX0GXF7_9ACTN|nr:helix-turn-helix transcriptional regulator [Motilibacter deserti]NHC15658.1 helix-turn-helix transcriptional regulator [Motilibacter deserti]